MPKGFDIKVKGLKELARNLEKYDERLQKAWTRGAVSEGVNEIRDQAILNALGIGLGFRGQSVTPSGRPIERRGAIPVQINSSVIKRRVYKGMTQGRVGVRSGGRGETDQAYHWRFLEFGSIHNTPTPFFAKSLDQAKGRAISKSVEVISRQTKGANRWGTGGGT